MRLAESAAIVCRPLTWNTTLQTRWQGHIVSTQDVLRGKPRVRNTRVPASLVLGYLAAGWPADRIIAQFPGLTAEDIAACLDYARDLADFEVAV